MISFIIIGKNEGWKIIKCLDSVYNAIKKHKITNPEVIYVDSKSKDDTIKNIKKYKDLKILSIEGDINAAIARNIGFLESKKDNLFFIDGDMEIQADFLPLILDKKNNLKYLFCSGNWINYNYLNFDKKEIVNKEIKKKMDRNENSFLTGGLFAIKRKTWCLVGGMKTKFRRSQDWDFALRLAKKNIFLYRLKEIFAIHHTLSTKESLIKMWSMFFSGYKLYRIVIMRDNFFNIYQWKHFLRINYTFIIFLIMLLSFIISSNMIYPTIYIITVFIRNIYSYKRKTLYVLNGALIGFLYDISFLGALLFFYPKNKKIKYKTI